MEDKPVTFLCPQWPAYGVGLPPDRMVSFQRGELTLSNPRDIEVLRHHALFGIRIFEAEDDPDAPGDPLPVPVPPETPPLPPEMIRLDGRRLHCPECGSEVSPDFATPEHLAMHRLRTHGVQPTQKTVQKIRRKRVATSPAANLGKVR